MLPTPVLPAGFCGVVLLLLLANRRLAGAHRATALALLAASSFFAVSFVVPLEQAPQAMILGELIFLIGAVEYHVLQSRRGQFLSRFLAPQVAKLVSERGLTTAMQEDHLEITVVCCDLRGFTAYAQANPSPRVLQVLREYYDAVGRIVAEYGATIKDFAGDGILVLVGAPLPNPRHARLGVEMAQKIRNAAREVTARASIGPNRLGVGVGAASGFVTVGVIGSRGRFEYTAVGPAVNLASRLCEQASDGDVLVAAETIGHCGGSPESRGLEARPPMAVKGYADPVPHFNVRDTAATLASIPAPDGRGRFSGDLGRLSRGIAACQPE